MLILSALQVEPQEKKKTPKGRAKKRLTYTRRFVNVTMTGGKRKVSDQSRAFSDGRAADADHSADEPEPNLIRRIIDRGISGVEHNRLGISVMISISLGRLWLWIRGIGKLGSRWT